MSSILVLDDRAADRELLATLLEHAGHSVSEAATGDEALALVRAQRPDLVITDIVMPEMNGYEFVRRLRGEPDMETIPVIFCTANYSLNEVRRLAAAVGVSRFLSKPSEFEDIVSTVNDVLGAPTTAPSLPLAGEQFDREQLRLLNEKLVEKVGELEAADAERRNLLSPADQRPRGGAQADCRGAARRLDTDGRRGRDAPRDACRAHGGQGAFR